MKRGVPPTERNARTGELTPPGVVRCARANRETLVLPVVLECCAVMTVRTIRVKVGANDSIGFVGFAGPEIAVGNQLTHAQTLRMCQRCEGKFLCFGDRFGDFEAVGQHSANGCRQR